MDNSLSAETEALFDGKSALPDGSTLGGAAPPPEPPPELPPGADESGMSPTSIGRRLATRRDKLEALGLLIGILGILLLASATIGSVPRVGP